MISLKISSYALNWITRECRQVHMITKGSEGFKVGENFCFNDTGFNGGTEVDLICKIQKRAKYIDDSDLKNMGLVHVAQLTEEYKLDSGTEIEGEDVITLLMFKVVPPKEEPTEDISNE